MHYLINVFALSSYNIILYVTGKIITYHRPSAILKGPQIITFASYGNNVYISGKDNV